jgi:uroporphyrinogen decarboxylase
MRIPFSPSVYEHAARWAGCSPWEASRDPEQMFRGHRDAWLAYRHRPIVVGIDIYNLEAEAYGARVVAPQGEDSIPAIAEPLFGALDEALDLPPFDPARDGRIAMVIGVGRRLQAELPEAEVRIPVAGPFSIAINLLGIENVCAAVAERPEDARRLLLRLAENQAVFIRAICSAGLKIAFFESAAAPPLISPRQFRTVELPALTRALEITKEITGLASPCILGGDTVKILDDLLSTGTNYVVCNVETDQQRFVDRLCATHPQVAVRINMDPRIVACSDWDAIRTEVDRILAIAAGRPNCLMGTGCLPLETPPENIHRIREYLAG